MKPDLKDIKRTLQHSKACRNSYVICPSKVLANKHQQSPRDTPLVSSSDVLSWNHQASQRPTVYVFLSWVSTCSYAQTQQVAKDTTRKHNKSGVQYSDFNTHVKNPSTGRIAVSSLHIHECAPIPVVGKASLFRHVHPSPKQISVQPMTYWISLNSRTSIFEDPKWICLIQER